MALRTATTKGILALALDAVYDPQTGTPRNRSANLEELTEALDPGGVHVCALVFPHEHVGGVKVEAHIRTRWLIAVKERQLSPCELWLDVSHEAFDQHTSLTNPN